MSSPESEVVVVGGGQAGIAMSEHLTARGIAHVVLEKGRIAESWRTQRWDSLVANGPAWHDRFPGMEFADVAPDGFATKEQTADYFDAYAARIGAPVRCGVEVVSVRKRAGGRGFRVETSDGSLDARYVVAATGPFQTPVIPPIVPEQDGLVQLHSSGYRNPGQLPEGAVAVVGSGSSGVQIADELRASGRDVYLAVGPHDRPPRQYRGRDFVWWLGVLGKWEAATPPQGAEHVTIAVSGAHGGHTVDFRRLAERGIRLVGRAESFDGGVLRFAPDLGENIANGDANYLALLDEADAYIERNGLDLPEEPEARVLGPAPESVRDPLLELDLAAAGVTSIVWATGFSADYSWLQVDAVDEQGRPAHRRGVSTEPGVYFLGLPWQSRRGSSFIWGVWHDARYLADQIAIQRGYAAYTPPAHGAGSGAHAGATERHTKGDGAMATHTRIRTFNTRDTYPEQNLDNDLCQAVVAGGTVYLRGQIGQDLDTRESVGIGDVRAQAEKAMSNIDLLLREAGSSMQDIVKVTVYITDPRYREEVYREMGRWLKGVYPVSTGIVVQALARPEWLVEIDATAVLSAERADGGAA
ncbi:NAD(P)-binding domain-containing protein [Nocardiopsis coralliicola]